MDQEIRYVKLSDVDTTNILLIPVFALYRALMAYDYEFIKDTAPLSVDQREELLTDAFTSAKQLVLAKSGDKLVGFIATSHHDPSSISEMFVVEGYRKQGIGRQLFTELKSMVKGPLKVNSVWGNQASLGFYQALGFVPVVVGMTEVS